jgi:hypothetical protein
MSLNPAGFEMLMAEGIYVVIGTLAARALLARGHPYIAIAPEAVAALGAFMMVFGLLSAVCDEAGGMTAYALACALPAWFALKRGHPAVACVFAALAVAAAATAAVLLVKQVRAKRKKGLPASSEP